jgi:hypothetical protein
MSWTESEDGTNPPRRSRPRRSRWTAPCSVPTGRLPARANGQLAFGAYLWNEKSGSFTPHGLNVLTLRGTRIEAITAFLTPEAFGRFGLPDQIQP